MNTQCFSLLERQESHHVPKMNWAQMRLTKITCRQLYQYMTLQSVFCCCCLMQDYKGHFSGGRGMVMMGDVQVLL